ncbi:recombinase [Acidithiobacillus ferridurans]|nr:recombinase [Acidithiobacillus ferridurans]
MTMTISVRLEHLNSVTYGGQQQHDMRDAKRIPKYVDKDRSDKNSILIAGPSADHLQQEIIRHRKKAKQRGFRKDGRLALSGIVTFGTEAQSIINDMTPEKQNAVFRKIAERTAKLADRELISLVVHRDESAPHAHFMLRSYKHDQETGHEIPMNLTAVDLRMLQDVAGNEVSDLGITRGKSKKKRIADGEEPANWIHRSVKQLHETLPADIAKVEERRKQIEIEAEEALDRYLKNIRFAEQAPIDLEQKKGDEEKVKKRLEVYKKRAEDAEEKQRQLDDEKNKLDVDIAANREALEKLDAGIAKKQQEVALLDAQSQQKKAVTAQVRDAMPVLEGKIIPMTRNRILSQEAVDAYHAQVAEYIRDKAVQMGRNAIREAHENVTRREENVKEREAQVQHKESSLLEWDAALKTREQRLDNYASVLDENRKLKLRLETIGTHVGHILGIENASMNRGKTLRAVESASSMASFRKALAEQRLIMTGQGRGDTPGY